MKVLKTKDFQNYIWIAKSKEKEKILNKILDNEEDLGRIQNGDWDTDADCVSSRNQGPCWDNGDTLSWNSSQWKATPYHNTSPVGLLDHDLLPSQASTQQAPRTPACGDATPPGSCQPDSPPAEWQPLATGGLQQQQTPARRQPRRCKNTGMDAKGVTPEQLWQKFCCPW
jgi:hypothetical protein